MHPAGSSLPARLVAPNPWSAQCNALHTHATLLSCSSWMQPFPCLSSPWPVVTPTAFHCRTSCRANCLTAPLIGCLWAGKIVCPPCLTLSQPTLSPLTRSHSCPPAMLPAGPATSPPHQHHHTQPTLPALRIPLQHTKPPQPVPICQSPVRPLCPPFV